jgi:hypothetical protein
MIEKKLKGLSGKEIVLLIPETVEEKAQVLERVEKGEVGDQNSFGDFKKPEQKEAEKFIETFKQTKDRKETK